MEKGKQSQSGLEFKLHPLVLINLSDHHTRVAANGTPTPVIGCLLGSQNGRSIDVSNSFEIKYLLVDDIVQIDNPFLLRKQDQYKQTFKALDVVGWYATGSTLSTHHLDIHRKITELTEAPVFLLFNPRIDLTRKDLPVELFETELLAVDGSTSTVFVKAKFTIETSDAERIGVDQVANITPSGMSSGSEQLSSQLGLLHSAIKMLAERLRLVQSLLAGIQSGAVSGGEALARRISALVHSLPSLDTPALHTDFYMDLSDTLLSLYLACMTHGTAQAHDVIDKFMLAYDKSAVRRRGLL